MLKIKGWLRAAALCMAFCLLAVSDAAASSRHS